MGTVWRDEKIIHAPSMRDYLVKNGGILKKTKPDLRNPGREIYIFKKSSLEGIMGGYTRAGHNKGGHVSGNQN